MPVCESCRAVCGGLDRSGPRCRGCLLAMPTLAPESPEEAAFREGAYRPRPVAEVTTEDLIATITRDGNDLATFEARHAFATRCRTDWRVFAPIKWRTTVTTEGGPGCVATISSRRGCCELP
jgi:hypothetical protein